jgi:hypothetical protein
VAAGSDGRLGLRTADARSGREGPREALCRCVPRVVVVRHDDADGAPLVPTGVVPERDPGERAASSLADPGVGPGGVRAAEGGQR